MDQDELIRKLKLEVRVERSIIVLAALFLIGWSIHSGLANRHYAVMANDKPVAVLATRQAAERALAEFKRAANPPAPNDVSIAENVTIAPVSSGDVVSEDAAIALLKKGLTVRLMKYAILADGTPVVAVDSEDMAGQVLEGVKQLYGGKVKHLMEEPGFKQKVSVKKQPVDAALYAPTVEDAIAAATSGPAGPGVYTVAKGDIAGSIAEKFHMKLADLQAMNGGKNLDKLQIGDQIRVSMKQVTSKKPRLIVVVRNQEEDTEVVPFNTQSIPSTQMKAGKQVVLSPGQNGQRKVVRAVTYENGVRTGMEVVSEKLIKNAVPRKIAVGSQ